MNSEFHTPSGEPVSALRAGSRRWSGTLGPGWRACLRGVLIAGPGWLLAFVLTAGFLFAQSRTITAAADPWPPFADPSAPKQGVALEIIRAAYRTQGYSVVMHFVPWGRAEAGATSGQYDLLIDVWLTEARKRRLLFSEPYAHNALKFIKRREDPFEFNGLESLAGKVIGTVRGYGYGDAFLESTRFRREEASDLVQNIRKLLASRIDLALEDEIVAKAILGQKEPGMLGRIAFTQNALSNNPLHVAAGLNNPRCRELVEAFNAGLQVIKNDRTYDRILADHGLR